MGTTATTTDVNRSLTAVEGVLAGHWTHASGTTGTTAVLLPGGAVGGVAIPGSASGSRETPVLAARHLARRCHGFCLSGGSAFGLAAADGVMEVLAERGIGHPTRAGVVPIVPAAILYDLPGAAVRPDRASGRAAAEAASSVPLGEGRVGAGAGGDGRQALGGGQPGGFGSWAETVAGHSVAAGVAVNALGNIRDPHTGEWVAGGPVGAVEGSLGENTTLAVVATDASLDRGQAEVLARMAAAGMGRTIWPAFTPFDGDTVFAAATGDGEPVDPVLLASLGHVAAEVLATAILRAVRAAAALPE